MISTFRTATLAVGVSFLALTGAVQAQEETLQVGTIDVDASYGAAQDSNAAEYYPEISNDLKAAIAERVPTSDDASDVSVRVDVRKMSLDGATMLPESREFNELEGVVDITSQNGTMGDLAFPVNVKAVTGSSAVPEGYIAMPPSDGDYYVAMVDFFADQVAERLANMNASGDEVSR
tara:strand:- start:59 stop:589 length:531 start_codon:yes stop_codon:yes gene_type:complete